MDFKHLVVAAALVTGCGGEADGPETEDAAAGVETGGLEYEPLIEGTWTLEPNTEKYLCVRKTIEEDTWLTALAPIDSPGVHHGLVTLGPAVEGAVGYGPDGTVECPDGGSDAKPGAPIYTFGVNTNATALPPGVGIRIPAGSQLLLNVHIWNSSDVETTGVMGVSAAMLPEEDVEHEAGYVLVGDGEILLPPGEETKEDSVCTMKQPTTLLAVGAHMHGLGTHMKVTAHSSPDGEVVLLDAEYDFNEQTHTLLDPIEMVSGDTIDVTCTFMNDTDEPVIGGDSFEDEMCVGVLLIYPPPEKITCRE